MDTQKHTHLLLPRQECVVLGVKTTTRNQNHQHQHSHPPETQHNPSTRIGLEQTSFPRRYSSASAFWSSVVCMGPSYIQSIRCLRSGPWPPAACALGPPPAERSPEHSFEAHHVVGGWQEEGGGDRQDEATEVSRVRDEQPISSRQRGAGLSRVVARVCCCTLPRVKPQGDFVETLFHRSDVNR